MNHTVKGFFPSTEIVPVKAGNSFAIGLVNSAVTVLFMKPLVGTLFKDISPFHGLQRYSQSHWFLTALFTKLLAP